MTGRVFINYRREDSASGAARLRDRLVSSLGAGQIFMDVDNLSAGQRFDKELERALANTEVFLAVIGPRWLGLLKNRTSAADRDFVREEIAAALKRGITVVPVLIERAELPRGEDLPEDIREMVYHQKHDVSHEHFGRDVDALTRAIKGSGSRDANPTMSQPAIELLTVLLIGIVGGWLSSFVIGFPRGGLLGMLGTGLLGSAIGYLAAKALSLKFPLQMLLSSIGAFTIQLLFRLPL